MQLNGFHVQTPLTGSLSHWNATHSFTITLNTQAKSFFKKCSFLIFIFSGSGSFSHSMNSYLLLGFMMSRLMFHSSIFSDTLSLQINCNHFEAWKHVLNSDFYNSVSQLIPEQPCILSLTVGVRAETTQINKTGLYFPYFLSISILFCLLFCKWIKEKIFG